MQEYFKSTPTVPTQSVVELVKELSIGQRSADTAERLAAFLHSNIFPKFDVFFVEIYFPDILSGDFLPPEFLDRATGERNCVPLKISAAHPIVGDLRKNDTPIDFTNGQSSPDFLQATGNSTHLLIPIQDDTKLSGLIYFGSPEPYSFSPDLLSTLQAIAAVIGSRLKSMGMILQVKESTRAREYSDRLRTALYEISEHAHNSENISDLYAKLHQTVDHLIHARNFFIALVEDRKDGKYIKFPYYSDVKDINHQGLELKFDEDKTSITGYLLKTQRPLLLNPDNYDRICRENNIHLVGTRPHSWLGAPFYLNHIAGVVVVQSYNSVIYTEKDKELMAFVARHIGNALNLKRSVAEFKRAKEQAEQAEKNKSTFLADMSHEIRTPMNGIIGLTDLVLKSGISSQQRTKLEMVHSSAGRLLRLINDILDFSKIEAGKLELVISPFALRETIASALEILSVSAAKKSVELVFDCDQQIPDLLHGDADKLRQILINLAGNGIKFTDQGSVKISVCLKKTIDQQSSHVDLHFQIRDTGIGIPADKLDIAFEAFSQLGTTHNSNHRGTGLGLVIAAEMVEMMGGKISVESKLEVGTTFHFTVRLPTALSDPATEQRAEEIVPPSSKTNPGAQQPLHILLVEDEYINRTLAVSVLKEEGWEVTVAENGLQALEMVETNEFDLVLMDIQLPELNGYETTRTIRLNEKQTDRHLPIIAMTAYAIKGDKEKCLAAGMDGYIPKPIHPNQLRIEIENVLQQQN
jgi:signal transduction histidine kinase/CheY-like chemotaxis protein